MDVELENVLGFNGSLSGAILLPPSLPENVVTVAGQSVTLKSLKESHFNVPLRGHSDNISAVGLSPTGRFLATGQKVEANVLVWDLLTNSQKPMWRFEEQDGQVVTLCFSVDERVLVSATSDGTLFAYDLATGAIVARSRQEESPTVAFVACGYVKDAKKQDSSLYQFISCGPKSMSLWALEPVSGRFAHTRFTAPGFSRDLTCACFASDEQLAAYPSPNPIGALVFAGTTSGDVAVFSIASRSLLCCVPVCTGGVASIALVDSTSHAMAAAAVPGGSSSTSAYYGVASGGLMLLVGSGDGSLALLSYSPVVSGGGPLTGFGPAGAVTAGRSATSPLTPLATVKVSGAIYSLSPLPPTTSAAMGMGMTGPTAAAAVSVVFATSDGGMFRGFFAPSSQSPSSGAAGAGYRQQQQALAGGYGAIARYGTGAAAAVTGGATLQPPSSWTGRIEPFAQSHGSAVEGLMSAGHVLNSLFPTPVLAPAPVTAPSALAGGGGGSGGGGGGGTAKPASASSGGIGLLSNLPPALQAPSRCCDVFAIAFSPTNSELCCTAGADASVRCWDLNEMSCVSAVSAADAGYPTCLVMGADFHVSGWQDGTVRAWLSRPPAAAGLPVPPVRDPLELEDRGGPVSFGRRAGTSMAAFSAGGAPLSPGRSNSNGTGAGSASALAGLTANGGATSGIRNTPPLWFIQDAHPGREGGVTAMALSRNERMLVTGGASGAIRTWDTRTRTLLATFKEHAGIISHLALLPGDRVCVSGSKDKCVATWDLVGQRRITVQSQSGGLNAVAVLPLPPSAFGGSSSPMPGSTSSPVEWPALLTASSTRVLQVWDPKDRAPLMSLSYPTARQAASLAAAPANSPSAPAASAALTAAAAAVPPGGSEPEPEPTCIAVPYTRRDLAATGGSDGAIIFWELPSMRLLSVHVASSGAVRDLAFTPDDKQVLATCSDGTVSIWNVFA